ncbi:MAG: hypothetical protein L6R40_005687 [Gallowayella cf. fulva]|nr:MAG: hypothetical protein L6R40_005687 [Xanthomendoza cf. fulva]
MVWCPFRPYVPAVLRFGVFFPPGYPESPPLVTFLRHRRLTPALLGLQARIQRVMWMESIWPPEILP